MSKNIKRNFFLYASFAAILFLAYFANVAIQTHLGKKALKETGLEYHDLTTALSMAQAQSKPVLADLSAIWCPSCRKLDKAIFSNDQVKSLIESEYIMTRIEYESDEGKAFMEKYQVHGFPVLLVLNPQGEKLRQLPITFDPTEFMQLLTDQRTSVF